MSYTFGKDYIRRLDFKQAYEILGLKPNDSQEEGKRQGIQPDVFKHGILIKDVR